MNAQIKAVSTKSGPTAGAEKKKRKSPASRKKNVPMFSVSKDGVIAVYKAESEKALRKHLFGTTTISKLGPDDAFAFAQQGASLVDLTKPVAAVAQEGQQA